MYINDYSDLGLLPEPPVPKIWVPGVPGPINYAARWVASGLLWPVASAHREGNRLAAGWSFADGYASMLTELTSTLPARSWRSKSSDLPGKLSALPWQDIFRRETKRYIELGHDGAADSIWRLYDAGRALVFQSFLDFIHKDGTDAWKQIQLEQRRMYGERDMDRRQRYERILHNQVREKQDIGIPLQPPSGRAR
jgi:hypothetical protein